MGDQPDWVRAVNNPGTVLFRGLFTASSTVPLDVGNNGSLVINCQGQTATQQVLVRADFLVTRGPDVGILTDYYTADLVSGDVTGIVIETPVYGPFLNLVNTTVFDIGLTVIAAARTVDALRVLNDGGPGRAFGATGDWPANVAVPLAALDAGPATYASNAETSIDFQTNTNGNLFFEFVDSSGAQREWNLGTVTAATNFLLTIGLPRCVGRWIFVPTAINHAGTAQLSVAQAQQ